MLQHIRHMFLIFIVSAVVFAGREVGNGGNGMIFKILIAKTYAEYILKRDDKISLAILSKAKRQAFLEDLAFIFDDKNNSLLFNFKGNLFIEKNEQDIVVTAKTMAKPKAVIEFNLPKCIEESLNEIELASLILHEIGHHFNMSVSMIDEYGDAYADDIALKLMLHEIEQIDSVFTRAGLQFSATQSALKLYAEFNYNSSSDKETCFLCGVYYGLDETANSCFIELIKTPDLSLEKKQSEADSVSAGIGFPSSTLEQKSNLFEDMLSLKTSFDISNLNFNFQKSEESSSIKDKFDRLEEVIVVEKWEDNLPVLIAYKLYDINNNRLLWKNSCNIRSNF